MENMPFSRRIGRRLEESSMNARASFAQMAVYFDKLPKKNDNESRESYLTRLTKEVLPEGTNLASTPIAEPKLGDIRSRVAEKEQRMKRIFINQENKKNDNHNPLMYVLINPEIYPMSSLVLEYFNETYGASPIYLRDLILSKEQKYLLHEEVIKKLGLEAAPGCAIRIGVPSKLVVLKFPDLAVFKERLHQGRMSLSTDEEMLYNSNTIDNKGIAGLFKARFKGVIGTTEYGTVRGDLIYPVTKFIIDEMKGLEYYFDKINYFRWAIKNVKGYNIHEVFSGVHIPDSTRNMIYELSILLNSNDIENLESAVNCA